MQTCIGCKETNQEWKAIGMALAWLRSHDLIGTIPNTPQIVLSQLCRFVSKRRQTLTKEDLYEP